MILKLENTTTHQIYEYEVKDMNNGEKLYFRFDIDTSNLVDGEYILSLYDGEKLVANDLLKIGDYNPSTLQYKKGENTYINVTLDNSVQGSKSVVIETIDTTITPDDGFNSMGKVDVNAQPIYDEGYNVGNTEGYNRGYAEGEAKGVENAGSIIAETARVLDITENGTYFSRYSEIPTPDVITGVYPDGTEFYNYAELNGKVFNTNITATPTTRLEMWYKGDNNKVGDAFNIIIGAGKYDDRNVYQIRYDYASNDRIRVELGPNTLYHTWNENAWHHILIAKETEDASVMSLWIDEVKVGDFGNISFNPQSTFYINNIEYGLGWGRRANGCFGMIKIDDQTFIPTADGYRNINTGELLEVAEEGVYIFTDNINIPEGNLIKTVNVNITPKINIEKYKIKFSYSNFAEVPEWADFEGITDMSYMFSNCKKLLTVPLIDTSKVKTFAYTFRDSEITKIPQLNTSNCTDFTYCFNATKITELPQLDLSKGNSFYEFCYNCRNLKYVPNLDLSSATNISGLLENCNALISVGEIKVPKIKEDVKYFLGGATKNNLTDFGGLIGLRGSITSNGFNTCPNLSYESCINILNGLYDFTGNGITPSSNEGKLKVHQNFLDTVGDEISIGVAKGWVISA